MATEDSQVGTRLLCLTDPCDTVKFTETKAVDVVAVHGLDAAGGGSWRTQDGTLWLRDLLPTDIPCGRVLAFLYDAKALFSRFPAHVDSVARSLLSALAMSRRDVPSTRPLVFVGHGFGGFIVEAVVNYAIAHEIFPDIKACLKKVIFLSTPQRSSPEIPWKTLLVNSAKDSLYGLGSSAIVDIDILKCIERNAQSFQKVRAEFRKHAINLKLKILTCYEGALTPPQQSCTVTEFCATLALKAEKVHRMSGCNHLFTARFENREDDNYKVVISVIKSVKGTTTAGLTLPKTEQNVASSDNFSVKVPAIVPSPAELPQVTEVLVQKASINRDVPHPPKAIVHPRSLSTTIVGTTTSTQMNSCSITHVDTPAQRPSLPSSLSIQAPTRHLSLSGIGHDVVPHPNSIPDILKPRPNSLYTHTAAQGQMHPQSTSRVPISTEARTTGPEKQVTSQKFIPYRPFAAHTSVATPSGQRSVGGNSQAYKPFRPLSMQMPRQQDQMQRGIKDPSTLPMQDPPTIPSSTFPTRPISATMPSILTSGPPLDRGLSGQSIQGIAPTGPVTRDISSNAVPLPIPRSVQPGTLPAPAAMRELPTASGPPGHQLATSQLPGPLQAQTPTSIRSSQDPFKPIPPAPTTSRSLPPQSTSSAPVVNIAVPASSATRSINVPSPMPTISSGPIIPPKPVPYRGHKIQSGTVPEGPPSNMQSQSPVPRSLGISRPPPTTTRSLPGASATQPPQPLPKQGQGPPMRSSISGPPGAPPGPTPISRGPPGPSPNLGPRGAAPLQPQPPRPDPSRPPLIKLAPPRPVPPSAPVPTPSATRGLQTGPNPPPKPPGILNKLFGSSTRPSVGPTRGPPLAPSPAGRGMPKPAPDGEKYTPYPGPTGTKQPRPKPPVPPQTRQGPAYHQSPHANDTGKDMGWKTTGEGSRGFHQPHTSMGSQNGHQKDRGLNSLYFSDQPIPPPQLVLQTQPQVQGPPGYLQSQEQVQGPVQSTPGDQKPEEKESSSSSSTIKIAAGVAVGAAIGGLATGAIISALQENEDENKERQETKETQESVQSGLESTSPVSGSVAGEDIPRDIPPSNQGGGDIDPSQQEMVAEVETETGSTIGYDSVSTPGSTSDSSEEGGDEDEWGYTGGYDSDGDGYEHYDDHEHGDASYDPYYHDAQHDQYNNDEDGDYDEYGNTEQSGDEGLDKSEYENEAEPTYQLGEQYQDDYQDEGEDEDEHNAYEDGDQEEEGYPDYQYLDEYENNEHGDGDDEEDSQTYESGDEYQGEYTSYEHQAQDHEEVDEGEDDESENDEQTGHSEGEGENQETEYGYEYDHNENDDDENEDDYQQYEPEYQAEYQDEVEYEPQPDYQVSYEPEYQPEYQQEYQPEYEPEYEEQTDYGGYGDYDQGYDYDDGYY
ncbi:hypothetical protein ASPVEDRAFT_76624 [Aspergillus versicolor CBS 583.65]|uniref:DUF676 domain-containing protein n=1 Tax=Aspergillus versicolor CBS 583.65 TaxID=1036611 RepID=A0A1L9Q286_ASPVE|nr:uncharacterized protein ASPVEDRAFT_76624 [Aspergillus versicolor CBS 583.65]OJJ07836.1 hypothetical protein ASPVEDRAFT_76624 [Aspergillus versicolor CBS 583.65]